MGKKLIEYYNLKMNQQQLFSKLQILKDIRIDVLLAYDLMIILCYWNIFKPNDLDKLPNLNKYYEARQYSEGYEITYRIKLAYSKWFENG